jgi:hypothetical protein
VEKMLIVDIDGAPRDFYDQQSVLLRVRWQRLAGHTPEALANLVLLRATVEAATDPRSATLLPVIDREIAAASYRPIPLRA